MLAATLIFASGCASYNAHTDKGAPYGIYPGARVDLLIVAHNWPNPWCVLFALDLPISTALDTMLLPADVLASGVEGKSLWAALPERTNDISSAVDPGQKPTPGQ